MLKVYQMKSEKGNPVANQMIIEENGKARYFQSYATTIVKIDLTDGKCYLDKNYWDYSRTTAKYRNMFLGLRASGIKEKIKTGEFILTELND